MKKTVLSIALCLLLFGILFPLTATVTGYASPSYPTTHIYDERGALSVSEKNTLENLALSYADKVPMYVLFSTTHSDDGRPYYMRNYGLTHNDDFVLLVVSRDGLTYRYNMHIYGKYVKQISEREMNFVLDHPDVYRNIKGGLLYAGATAWLDQTAGVSSFNMARRGIISAVFAVAVAGVACVIVVSSYRKKQRATNYPLDQFARMNTKKANDVFLTSNVTSYTVSSSSGGGKSGGGGGGRHGGR